MDSSNILLCLLIFLLDIPDVWCGGSVCSYMISSKNHLVIKTIYCKKGCCGEDDHQECCSETNYWMYVAFGLVGIFVLIIIIVIVAVVITKKNKKRARVDNVRQTNYFGAGAVERSQQRNQVNMSDFSFPSTRPARPPQPRSDTHTASQQPSYVDIPDFPHPVPTRPPAFTEIDPYGAAPPSYSVTDPEKAEDRKFDPWGKTMDL